jgi:hypothetical protein
MLRNPDPSPYKEIDIKGMEKELERKWNWKRNGYGAHKKNQYGLTTGQCELEMERIWSVQKKPIWSHSWTM